MPSFPSLDPRRYMRIAMLGMLLTAGWCAPVTQAETLPGLASPVVHAPTDATASDEATIPGIALDDQALDDERGSGLGAVAAMPELMQGGHTVTLWDELAPPAPAPAPVDAAKTAQVNVFSATRR